MNKLTREVKNCISMTLGFIIICLMFLFHLISPLNSLLHRYNHLVDYVNRRYDRNLSHQAVIFFGETMESIVILIDIIIVVIVVVVVLLVYLTIRWSIKGVDKK